VNLPLLIALRMSRSSSDNKGVMERVAVISVALSLTVMILALAVMLGFKREVSQKVAGFSAHVVVCGVRGLESPDADVVQRTTHLDSLIRSLADNVVLAPYAAKGGIVRTADAVEGVLLKGVGSEFDWSSFREWLVEGDLPRVGDSIRTKDILISRNLSDRQRLYVGDKVELLFVGNDDRPRRDRFRVSGIYASGMDEMDDKITMTDIRNVQRLSSWGKDSISGYEIRLERLDDAEQFAYDLNLLLEEDSETAGLVAYSLQEHYPNIFDWLRAHDVNAVVIWVVMLIVAFFNMASVLLILVLERTRMVGLLKVLGMRNLSLRMVFLYRAAFVAIRGLLWGNAIGLSLCLLQHYFHVVKLDAEGYLLSEVPIVLDFGSWLLLNVGFMIAIVALLIIPAGIISTVKPEETIRYE